MSDKIFRSVIVGNLTVAVVGGLILGGLNVAGKLRGASSSNQFQRVELTADLFTQNTIKDSSSRWSNALNNIGASLKELAPALKELAAAQRLAAENGRYQQVQTPAAAGAPVQFFDTRTGELKATQ